MQHERFTLCIILVLVTFLSSSFLQTVEAVDRRCVVPSLTGRFAARKEKPDIEKSSIVAPTPYPAVECAWYEIGCHLSPCKQWGGELESGSGVKVDMATRMGRILRERLVGQELAISQMVAAMRSKRDGSPLSMHFVGDNGTGKTLAASIYQSALFVDEKPAGVLYLRGNSFIAHESTATANYRNELLNRINAQLRKCPNSLIIIDELQLMHRNTILVFEQFLDDTFVVDHTARGGADPSGATFIFISDFGKEGTSSGDTPDELVVRAHKESVELWKGGRTAHLIQHIIPFMPATSAGAFELVSELTQNLFTLPYFERNHLNLTGINICEKDHLLNGLTKYVWNKQQNSSTQLEQYRGLKKTFDSIVLREVTDKAATLHRARKLYEIPKTEAPAPISLSICTNNGESLKIEVAQPWCSELDEAKRKERRNAEKRELVPVEVGKEDL